MIKGIICIDKNGGIGKGNSLLAHLPKDLQHFKEVTFGKTVVMGRTTWESLPYYPEGLPDRNNNIISRDENPWKLDYQDIQGNDIYLKVDTLSGTKYHIGNLSEEGDDVVIIGGASIYSQLEHFVEEWIITEIDHVFEEANVFFKPDLTNFEDTLQYKNVSSEEYSAKVSIWRKK